MCFRSGLAVHYNLVAIVNEQWKIHLETISE